MPEQQKHWLLTRFGRVQGLTLEIVAIFIGITASFWVDEWREERANYTILDQALEGIYYDTLRDQAWVRRNMEENNQRIALVSELLFGDLESLTYEELGAYIGYSFSPSSADSNTGAYEGLKAAELSLPFDATLQQLRFAYDGQYFRLLDDFRRRRQDGWDLAVSAFDEYGFVTNHPHSSYDAETSVIRSMPRLDLPELAGVRRILIRDGVFLPDEGNLEQVRALVESGQLKKTARQLLQILLDLNGQLESIYSVTEVIQIAVRERLPAPELPIETLGLRGSAIDETWARTEHLERDADSAWWSGEMELNDGMVKILANEAYAISWGVEPDWSQIEPFSDPTHFLGDPATVFPTGTAVFDGQNIPVTAGRYRVRFNSRTFEYSFEQL